MDAKWSYKAFTLTMDDYLHGQSPDLYASMAAKHALHSQLLCYGLPAKLLFRLRDRWMASLLNGEDFARGACHWYFHPLTVSIESPVLKQFELGRRSGTRMGGGACVVGKST